jgi:hypothetical protein
MSFLASFVTGFATQAQKDIEERDKELRDEATMRWNNLLKEREKSKLRAEKRGEEIDDLARKMKAYGITDENQIVAALSSGTAPEIVESLTKMKERLTPARAAELIKVEPGQEIPTLAAFREKVTTLQPGVAAKPSEEQMTGAFGLRTRAFEQGLKSASAQTGVSIEDIYKTKLAEIPTVAATVNLSSLMSDKQVKMADRIDALRAQVYEFEIDPEYGPNHPSTVALKERLIAANKINSADLGKPDKEKTERQKFEERAYALFNEAAESKDGKERASLVKQGQSLLDMTRAPEKEKDGDKGPTVTGSTLLSRAFHAGAAQAATKIGSAHFTNVPNQQGGVDRVFTPTNDYAARYGTALGHAQVQLIVDRYKDPTTGAYPKWVLDAIPTIHGAKIENNKPVFFNVEEATAAAQASAAPQASKPSGVAAARSGGTQAKTIVRTGTIQSGPDKGKKVIEYSDGTREIQ